MRRKDSVDKDLVSSSTFLVSKEGNKNGSSEIDGTDRYGMQQQSLWQFRGSCSLP